MCGRYTIIKHDQVVRIVFNFTGKTNLRLVPRYNAAVGQYHPIIMNGAPPAAAMAQWGLVPSWSATGKMDYDTFNAKSETLTEKRTFAPLVRHRRCLVPADGFIEWRRARKQKIPYHLRLKTGDPFCFAGLWDSWRDELLTYTVITTVPNDIVKPLHHRMPVMLREADFKRWLDGGDLLLLRPFPAEEMEAVEINPLVNSTRVDSPDCLNPPTSPFPGLAETPPQQSLF